MPLERMTRRGVLAGIATLVGSGAMSRRGEVMPRMEMQSGFAAGRTTVDPRVNGFDPMHVLRDFDWGKTRRLASGRVLREWQIVAWDKEIEVVPGVRLAAWTYNGRVPGPTLRCREGEALRIHFVNAGSHAHTLHFHGIHRDVMDGVDGIGRGLIEPGEDFVYEFDAHPFGLHLYHCHAEPLAEHISKGLYGVFIIDPKRGRADADELVMVQNAFDSNFDGDNNIYAVNTVAFHFLYHPIRVVRDRLVRIYLVNIVELDPINSFHVHGNFFHRFPTGTSLEPTEYTDTITQGQAQHDVLELRFPYTGVVLLLCAATLGVAAVVVRPWHHASGGSAVVAQSSLRPGGFDILVRNDSARALSIAQVTVNDEFVPFHGGRVVLFPHAQTRLLVDYGWVKGEPYEIGVLTATGDIIDSEVGGESS